MHARLFDLTWSATVGAGLLLACAFARPAGASPDLCGTLADVRAQARVIAEAGQALGEDERRTLRTIDAQLLRDALSAASPGDECFDQSQAMLVSLDFALGDRDDAFANAGTMYRNASSLGARLQAMSYWLGAAARTTPPRGNDPELRAALDAVIAEVPEPSAWADRTDRATLAHYLPGLWINQARGIEDATQRLAALDRMETRLRAMAQVPRLPDSSSFFGSVQRERLNTQAALFNDAVVVGNAEQVEVRRVALTQALAALPESTRAIAALSLRNQTEHTPASRHAQDTLASEQSDPWSTAVLRREIANECLSEVLGGTLGPDQVAACKAQWQALRDAVALCRADQVANPDNTHMSNTARLSLERSGPNGNGLDELDAYALRSLTTLSLRARERDSARTYARELVDRFPQSRHAGYARRILERP